MVPSQALSLRRLLCEMGPGVQITETGRRRREHPNGVDRDQSETETRTDKTCAGKKLRQRDTRVKTLRAIQRRKAYLGSKTLPKELRVKLGPWVN